MRLEPDYADAYNKWKADPQPTNTGELLRAVDPVLRTAVKTYGGQKPSPTLMTRARALAANSFDSYDPQRGSLRTHLLGRLQRLRRFNAQEQATIRVPEAAALQRQRMQEIEHDFQETKGRLPSSRELADTSGLSLRRIASLRQAHAPVLESTISEAYGGTTPAARTPIQQLPTWLELAYDDLAPTDQFILERSLGLHGQTKQSASGIAKQLNISPAAVSKRMDSIQRTLDMWEDLQ